MHTHNTHNTYTTRTQTGACLEGNTGWVQRIFTLTVGAHTLEWRYVKDGSGTTTDR